MATKDMNEDESARNTRSFKPRRLSYVAPLADDAFRHYVGTVLHSNWYDLVIGCVVLLNIAVVIVEVDAGGRDEDPPGWVGIVNNSLLTFYGLEVLLRMYVEGRKFLKDKFSLLDMFLVLFDVSLLIFDSHGFKSSILRVARLAKISRSAQILVTIPELHLMMKGLAGAFGAILWGSLLTVFMIVVLSIFAVVFIHPINREIDESTRIYEGCNRCAAAYSSVFQASLTFTQVIICGDSWGQMTLPIIEKEPWTLIFFYFVFASLALAGMNLILAVICDSAQQARHLSVHELAVLKETESSRTKDRLAEMCSAMDLDGNGQVSLEEFQQAFRENQEFADILRSHEMGESEIRLLFGLMDRDRSGEVSYAEFVEELWKMQSNDLHNMIIYIRFYVTEIRNQLVNQIDKLSEQVIGRIDAEEKTLEAAMHDEEELVRKALEMKDSLLEVPARILIENKANERHDSAFPFEEKSRSRLDAALLELTAKLEDSDEKNEVAFAALEASIQTLVSMFKNPEQSASRCPPLAWFPEGRRKAPVQPTQAHSDSQLLATYPRNNDCRKIDRTTLLQLA